jgi:hypothetical protein
LEELMASKPLGVEVHDRNLKPPLPDPDDVTEEDQRLALLAAEPDLRLDDWSALVGGSRRSFEVVEKAIRSISWVACKPPQLEKSEGDVTLEEVDQLFRLALVTSWCKCGDDHAHGQRTFESMHCWRTPRLWREPSRGTIRRSQTPYNHSLKLRVMSRAEKGE